MHILCGVKAALKQRDVGTNQKVTFEVCVCVCGFQVHEALCQLWFMALRGEFTTMLCEDRRLA